MKKYIIMLMVAFSMFGCATNSTEHVELSAPISEEKAELTGSKLVSEGGIPHQIWAQKIDGKLLRQFAVDVTKKIWPVNPGEREIGVEYLGSTGKAIKKPFSASSKITAKMEAGHRYILKIRRSSPDGVTFYLEDQASGTVVAESEEEPLIGITIPIYVTY